MATARKQQQNITIAIVIVVLAILTWGIFYLAQPKADIALGKSLGDGSVDITIVKEKTSHAAPEHTWVNQSRVQIEEMQKQIENLTETAKTTQLEQTRQINEMEADYASVVEQMALQIANLQEELESTKTAVNQRPTIDQNSPYANTGSEFIQQRTGQNPSRTTQLDPYTNKPVGGQRNAQGAEPATEVSADSFGKTFSLASKETAKEDNKTRNKLSDYVPAGSYAQAVVISGADAATNVTDRENPIPVLLRVIGPAVTANKKKISGIKGCVVQGSAVGDLSAERVHVRLISMTCTNNRNEVIEQKVAGHVVGSGKSGVRGHVTSREGGLVTSAALAGAMNGLAGALAAAKWWSSGNRRHNDGDNSRDFGGCWWRSRSGIDALGLLHRTRRTVPADRFTLSRHKSRNRIHKWSVSQMIRFVSVIAICGLLAGCVSLGANTQKDFLCEAQVGSPCATISQADGLQSSQGALVSETVEDTLLGTSMALPALSEKERQGSIGNLPSVEHAYETQRYRVPEEIGRLWIAPYRDENQILHQARFVHFVMRPARWASSGQ